MQSLQFPRVYALERRRWDEAAKLPCQLWVASPGNHFRWAEAHIYFARAIGAARTGDIQSATREVNN